MPVSTFVDDPEPMDPRSSIWRYIEFWKLQDLVQTGQLYFRRSDKLKDEHEGLPPSEYERVLKLSTFDLNDIQERDHRIGSLAQFRQSFYVNCWHLHIEETATMWARYGKEGVAIVSRYDLLKQSPPSVDRQGNGRAHQVRHKAPDRLERHSIRYHQARKVLTGARSPRHDLAD